MNPVAVAISRAVESTPDPRRLSDAFDREWGAVEFAPDAESVVCNVSTSAAREWWLGDLSDFELALTVTRRPAAIWWASLPRHDQFRAGLQAARRLYLDGATLLVCQTRNPVIARHAARFGFRSHQFPDGITRLMAEPPALARWLGRMT